ncbi:uncharacterized protein LOC132739746 isoform X2 [Ruditapes philippinarum]|uniref:uncharacterized protein LOC132739746 isoform X2 n=1 Tax=Ruditapes philippinarum TaxID=129788 RepID=UPI00295C2B5E|nr:uncharacterized protein LOC132739746 isoform X2 [Ruditapes philippinarum]
MFCMTPRFLFTFDLLLLGVKTQILVYQDVGNQSNFHFKNCNRSAVPFYVQRFQLDPDPINLREWIILTVEFNLERDVGLDGNRIDVDLNWRLKTDRGYTELCDIIGEYYCHLNDLCAELERLMKHNKCPQFMMEKYDNNCSCPFLKNEYKIPSVPIIIPKPLPIELRGTFDLTVKLQEQGTRVGCIQVEFCITDCKPLGG